jgi:hypothetical protein
MNISNSFNYFYKGAAKIGDPIRHPDVTNTLKNTLINYYEHMRTTTIDKDRVFVLCQSENFIIRRIYTIREAERLLKLSEL